jgi:hypothetical protein
MSTSCKLSSLNTDGRLEQFLSCMLPLSWKRFARRDIVDLFGMEKSGNVSLNSFCKLSKNEIVCSTVNNHCTCEKDILALQLFEDN